MDLNTFFHALKSRWRLLIIIWGVVFVVGIVYALLLPTLYKSEGTYIIRPDNSIEVSNELVDAIATLSRRSEINSTYAEIARSRTVKEYVIDELELSSREIRDLQISGRPIPGTNVLEISVIANNPDLAMTVAGEVARETLVSAEKIYDVFELELLDDFEMPNRPIKSNRNIIILLGIFFGFFTAVGIIFVIEIINIQVIGKQSDQFVDRRSGQYTRSYFDHRLSQEISRSYHKKYDYSLALIRLQEISDPEVIISSKTSKNKFDKIYNDLRSSFREEDVIAEFDLNTIGLLIPDLQGEDTKNRIEAVIKEQEANIEHDQGESNHQDFAIGIVSVESHQKNRDELLRLLSQAVFLASEDENGGIFLRTDESNNLASSGG